MAHGSGVGRIEADLELEALRELSLRVSLYLSLVLALTFLVGVFSLYEVRGEAGRMIGIALVGAAGSAVAALTSCLDRYANGFEREMTGEKVPPGAKGETFNRRMARWFYFRPLLGIIVAPVFVWGLELFSSEGAKFTSSLGRLGFSAFMGGLLAKSVIDLIKGLFKNVFKT